MTSKLLSLVLLAVALALLVFWVARPSDGSPDLGGAATVPAVSEPTPREVGFFAGATSAAAVPSVTGGAREPVPAPGFDAEGVSVEVRVLWQDRSPAPGISVSLRLAAPGLPRRVVACESSDADGMVRFSGLDPGSYRVRADRGKEVEIEVVAGQDQDFEIVLDEGVHVSGVVVDAGGQPVGRARVWLQTAQSDWAAGRVVAVADGAGRFELAAIPADLSLGALAAEGGADAPSQLVDLDLCDVVEGRVELRLVLEVDGGRIVGTVRDAVSGLPLGRARVAFGPRDQGIDSRGGRVVEKWSPRTVETDADGRFVFDGVRAGEVVWSAARSGFGLARGTVAVEAGEIAQLEVALAAAAALVGTMRDEAGAPRPGVAVRAYDREPGTNFIQTGQIDFDEVFDHAATTTDADGRYRLDGVTPGTVHAFVQAISQRWGSGTGLAYVTEQLELAAGEERTWDPVLTDGLVIEGRALYRDGHPLEHQFVSLRNAAGQQRGTITTDADGRFRFVCLTEPLYSIYVQVFDQPRGSPPVQQTGVVPGRGPVEIRASFDRPVELEPARITGRVVDLGSRLAQPKAATVLLIQEDRSWRTVRLDDEGRFTFDEAEPGEVRIVVMDGEVAVFHGEPFRLEPAARHDVGTITTSATRAEVRVRVQRGPGSEGVELSLFMQRADGRRGATVAPITADEFVIANMQPGDFQWVLHGSGVVASEGVIELSPDAPAVLDIPVVAGARCKCDVRFADDADLGHVTVVYEREGQEFRRSEFDPGSAVDFRLYYVGATLPPGEYRIVLTTTTGLRAEAAVTVGASREPVSPVLELR